MLGFSLISLPRVHSDTAARWQRVNFRFRQNHLFKWDKIMPNLYKMYWPEATGNRNSTFYSWPNFSIFPLSTYIYKHIYIYITIIPISENALSLFTYRLKWPKVCFRFFSDHILLCIVHSSFRMTFTRIEQKVYTTRHLSCYTIMKTLFELRWLIYRRLYYQIEVLCVIHKTNRPR